jgi:hypothetical protein
LAIYFPRANKSLSSSCREFFFGLPSTLESWYKYGLLWWFIPPVRAERLLEASLSMKFVPPLCRVLRAAFALLTVSLLLAGFSRAQFPETPVMAAPPTRAAAAEWPNVDCQLAPAYTMGNREPAFEMDENKTAGEWLGPAVTFQVPQAGNPSPAAGSRTELEPKPPRVDLGNVTFNRTAASLNVQKSDVVKAGDLSRQFETVVGDSNVAPAVPISGWTVITIGGMVILIVLAITFHQKDSRRRKHRHRHRHRHHHHHHHGRSHGQA